MLEKYIPTVIKLKYRISRKKKKDIIKEFGRSFYFELIKKDCWLDQALISVFTEEYNKAMIERKKQLREVILKNITK